MAEQRGTGVLDASDEDNDSALLLTDVLQEEDDLEDEVNAVLGGSDDKNCTYPQGYVKRQALYACSTCVSPNEEPAGVCLACSYACHEGHELFELYTKRNFRCDCGNKKFPSNPCHLCPVKEPENSMNEYNQNFWGKYCTCRRPYPDPEEEQPDEMLQCIICEDWYHTKHLGSDLIDSSQYSEIICSGCMENLEFLRYYNQEIDTSTKGKRTNKPPSEVEGYPIGHAEKHKMLSQPNENTNGVMDESCKLKYLQRLSISYRKGCTLWLNEWRKRLCRCSYCLQLYLNHNCLYLLDEEDTIHSYEERGKAAHEIQSQNSRVVPLLQRLDRAKLVEVLHEFNDLSRELKDYLKKFAESRKVVRKEDIKEFFGQMKSRKRRRIE